MQQHEGDMSKSVKALSNLSKHVQILDPSPIDSYRSNLDRKWKTLANDVSARPVLKSYACMYGTWGGCCIVLLHC